MKEWVKGQLNFERQIIQICEILWFKPIVQNIWQKKKKINLSPLNSLCIDFQFFTETGRYALFENFLVSNVCTSLDNKHCKFVSSLKCRLMWHKLMKHFFLCGFVQINFLRFFFFLKWSSLSKRLSLCVEDNSWS